MRLPALAAPATLALLLLAGCADPGDGEEGEGMPAMGPGSFHMALEGMPEGAVAPGHRFNVTVRAAAGTHGMHAMASDHIGAHFWNRTVADPTAALGNSTACAHRGGDLPGQYTAMCTAPMQPGTYHLRSHARMADEGGALHHWWSDERAFTVA